MNNVPKTPASPKRMALGNITSGKQAKPVTVLLHGTEGVGKSTFGSCAPNPIFLCSEKGTAHLDVARFPQVGTWDDALEAIDVLTIETHKYETLVVDTLDCLEPFCWQYVVDHDVAMKSGKKPRDIEEACSGFQKGYIVALSQWAIFLNRLEKLQEKRGMHVVLLAHTVKRMFRNPEGDDFERYELQLHPKTAGKIMQWVDAVLFATYDTGTCKQGQKSVGISDGSRIMRCEKRAAFDAKNRYGLPFRMPLSWDDFFAGVQLGQPAPIEQMVAEARELGATAGISAQVEKWIASIGTDASKVAAMLDHVRGKIRIMDLHTTEQADKQ